MQMASLVNSFMLQLILRPQRLSMWIQRQPQATTEALLGPYYGKKDKACRIGLYALMANGMFTLHPKELGRHAQLYCVHAVCSGGVDVPVLFAIIQKRTEREYRVMFKHLKDQLDKFEGENYLPKKIKWTSTGVQ
ncbi:unnamed protein product [Cylicocyclus nassatus]|uniref:Uncharacterized protein n=1 Tax=Cylicocyclus nassatus TaxID=53992 RepID=A0AA36GDX5_CYLNA|nr:unnamed protein product [Cylicocyclus nassatus]